MGGVDVYPLFPGKPSDFKKALRQFLYPDCTAAAGESTIEGMFSTPAPLLEIVAAQKRGEARGIAGACTAQGEVLLAAMQQARADDTVFLAEATCNQVNQYGGYTGLTPRNFADALAGLAQRAGLAQERILLGGDHLGPNPWRKEPTALAMEKASEMVAAYVRAGFRKIHLDASMPCADDQTLTPEIVARRAAQLCAAAEIALDEDSDGLRPVYVIGTEVPPPGGAKEGDTLQVTSPTDALQTLGLFQGAFEEYGLGHVWERVIALVVQPGVEFGDSEIQSYDRERAAELARAIEGVPGIVYEAHSTDYQTPAALRALVEDHFAVLKVGPGLTYAYREALFALARIEEEWQARPLDLEPANLIAAALETMRAEPNDWAAYYHGSAEEIEFALKYSLSDRIRYYWLRQPLRGAVERLMQNLSAAPIPLSLLSQYMPEEYSQVRAGLLENHPTALARARVQRVMGAYNAACGGVRT
jgi:D-tagatose-1,6-bisphosphate aldolase subunit GatZ/KbaZ